MIERLAMVSVTPSVRRGPRGATLAACALAGLCALPAVGALAQTVTAPSPTPAVEEERSTGLPGEKENWTFNLDIGVGGVRFANLACESGPTPRATWATTGWRASPSRRSQPTSEPETGSCMARSVRSASERIERRRRWSESRPRRSRSKTHSAGDPARPGQLGEPARAPSPDPHAWARNAPRTEPEGGSRGGFGATREGLEFAAVGRLSRQHPLEAPT